MFSKIYNAVNKLKKQVAMHVQSKSTLSNKFGTNYCVASNFQKIPTEHQVCIEAITAYRTSSALRLHNQG